MKERFEETKILFDGKKKVGKCLSAILLVQKNGLQNTKKQF